MTVIGLTGGIASGKSTAARLAAERGAYVIDADVLGHRVYDPGTPGFDAVVGEFGDDIVASDGTIDRKVLGGKVFAEQGALSRLTDIVWPEIRRLAETEIERVEVESPHQVVVLEAAVLLEAGWDDAVDEIWAVIVDPETAIARATARDGVDRDAVQARIDAQLSNEERRGRADVVIDNSGTEQDLEEALDREWQRLESNIEGES